MIELAERGSRRAVLSPPARRFGVSERQGEGAAWGAVLSGAASEVRHE